MRTKEDHPFPSLPSYPLALAVERMLDPGQTKEDACPWFGISAKTLQEWLAGKRPSAEFNTADRVLCCTELNYWEVWTPENTSPEDLGRVERAFTGPDVDDLARRIRELEAETERLRARLQRAETARPLGRMDAIQRAVELRTGSQTVFSWRTISTIMSMYHGFDRSPSWWQEQLVSHGRVPRARVSGHARERMAAMA